MHINWIVLVIFHSQARSRGRGREGGGGLEPPPPQNFWKLKNNVPKNDNENRLMCTDQSVLNSDAASAFSQPSIYVYYGTCQFLSLTVCFYIQRQRRHSYLVNRK